MRKTASLTLTIIFALLLLPLIVKAQPQPPNVPTLGPAIIHSKGDEFTNVTIYSPQNQNYSGNHLKLLFSVEAVGMLGQFGNIGYSLDKSEILSVNNYLNKTVTNSSLPEWYYNTTTVYVAIDLLDLSKGVHNLTIYYGWQYLGTPENPSSERFEVYAYDSVEFIIEDNTMPDFASSSVTPTPTIPEYSSVSILLLTSTLTAWTANRHKKRRC